MARRLACVLMVLCSGLAACATTHSQSIKQASYSGHPKRIYLLVLPQLSEQMGADFSQQTVAKFSDAVAKCGGSLESHISSPLELDAQALTGAMQAFNPDVIMSMNFAGGTRDAYGGWIAARIDIRLWQPGAKQLAWRDESSVSAGGLTPVSTRADSFTKDLIQRMRTDGVFPPCPQLGAR